jgi:Fe2+ or Zn2+ uptake regulation protein
MSSGGVRGSSVTAVDDQRAAAILEKLQEDGGRITRTRRMIVDVVVGADEHHLTAADIVEGVRRLDPDFPESTVYRTLARLEQLGVIAPLAPARSTAYHVGDDSHVHAVCDLCGAMFELEPAVLTGVARRLRERIGFEVDRHNTSLHGRCADCLRTTD